MIVGTQFPPLDCNKLKLSFLISLVPAFLLRFFYYFQSAKKHSIEPSARLSDMNNRNKNNLFMVFWEDFLVLLLEWGGGYPDADSFISRDTHKPLLLPLHSVAGNEAAAIKVFWKYFIIQTRQKQRESNKAVHFYRAKERNYTHS